MDPTTEPWNCDVLFPAGSPSQLFRMDFTVLTPDTVAMLQCIVLTAEEEAMLKHFEGNVAELGPVDRYYVTLLEVPRCATLPVHVTVVPCSRTVSRCLSARLPSMLLLLNQQCMAH